MLLSRILSWQPCSAAKPVSNSSVLPAMAQPPSTQPPVMSFISYADSLKEKLAAAEAAAAASEERSAALTAHNCELQERCWQQQTAAQRAAAADRNVAKGAG